jgi:hypothetical protein
MKGSIRQLRLRGLERWKPRAATNRRALSLVIRGPRIPEPGSIPSRRAAGYSNEGSCEVRMVRKSGVKGDIRNGSLLTSELFAGPRDAPPSEVLSHRTVEPPPEQFGQVHGMDAGDASDTCKPVDLHQVSLEIGDTPVEPVVRLERTTRVCATSGLVQQYDRLFHTEHTGRVGLLELVPHAQGWPLNVTAKHASGDGRDDANAIVELAAVLRIEFYIERARAVRANLVRVRFVIVKDYSAAYALAC